MRRPEAAEAAEAADAFMAIPSRQGDMVLLNWRSSNELKSIQELADCSISVP